MRSAQEGGGLSLRVTGVSLVACEPQACSPPIRPLLPLSNLVMKLSSTRSREIMSAARQERGCITGRRNALGRSWGAVDPKLPRPVRGICSGEAVTALARRPTSTSMAHNHAHVAVWYGDAPLTGQSSVQELQESFVAQGRMAQRWVPGHK